MAETRVCSKCGHEKPLDEEHFRQRKGRSWHSWCRDCDREATRAYQAQKARERQEFALVRDTVIALLATPHSRDTLKAKVGPRAGEVLDWLRKRGRLAKVGEKNKRPIYVIGKRCIRCKAIKPLGEEAWSPDRRVKGVVTAWASRCRPCSRAHSAEMYVQNREFRKAANRENYDRKVRREDAQREREGSSTLRTVHRRTRKPDPALTLSRAGGVVTVRPAPILEAEGVPTVESRPFLRWWAAYLAAEQPIEDGGRPRDVMALSLGTSDRAMRRIETQNVTGKMELDMVDRAFIRVQLDFVHPSTGFSPAHPDYISGGIPEQTAGAELLRRYYPSLFLFEDQERPPSAEDMPETPLDHLVRLHLDADPMTERQLARSLGIAPRSLSPVLREMNLVVVGEDRHSGGNPVPVYALG